MDFSILNAIFWVGIQLNVILFVIFIILMIIMIMSNQDEFMDFDEMEFKKLEVGDSQVIANLIQFILPFYFAFKVSNLIILLIKHGPLFVIKWIVKQVDDEKELLTKDCRYIKSKDTKEKE